MITLTATMQDFTGALQGSVAGAGPSRLCIGLCAFGNQIPRIPGTAVIGRPGPIYTDSTSGSFSVNLYGNDVIFPINQTYYAISLLDPNGNVVQTGAYQLTGSGTVDLSSLTPIAFPGTSASTVLNFLLSAIPTTQIATGAVNGVNATFTFSAPQTPAPLIVVYAAGTFQNPVGGSADYSIAYSGSNIWTITFAAASIPNVGPIVVLIFQQPNGNSSTIAAPRTIVSSGPTADNTLFCNFSAPGTITLPSGSTAGAGYELTFIDVSYNAATNNITLSGSVNAGGSYIINTNGGAVTIRSDGTQWRVKSKF